MRFNIIILFILLLFILIGCGGGKNSKVITANSILNDDSLEFKLKVSNYVYAGDHVTFYSDKNIEQFKHFVDHYTYKEAILSTEIVNDSFLMIDKINADGEIYKYMIAKVGESNDKKYNLYHFSSPSSILDDNTTVFIPHHLIKPDNIDHIYFQVTNNKKYEMTGSKEDIFRYYDDIFIYDVTKTDNSIIVNINENKVLSGDHTKNHFTIVFSNENGKDFLIYQTES